MKKLVVAALILCAALSLAQPKYRLQLLDRPDFWGNKINNLGHIGGWVPMFTSSRAQSNGDFMRQAGVAAVNVDGMTKIVGSPGRSVRILGINNLDQLAGHSTDTRMNARTAWRYTDSWTDLGNLGQDYPLTHARAINDLGHVVGSSNGRGYMYANGSMIDIGTLGGRSSTAVAINSRDQVTGTSQYSEMGYSRAFLYDKGKMLDLTPGLQSSVAMEINDEGVVVGYVNDPIAKAAFWKDGLMTAMEMLPYANTTSAARGINSRGDMVGNTDDEGFSYGVVWIDGRVYDLNESLVEEFDGHIQAGWSINDRGDILVRTRVSYQTWPRLAVLHRVQ